MKTKRKRTKRPYLKIRSYSSKEYMVNKKDIIGFCHNISHKGCVTKSIIQRHKCLEKGCTFLEKYTNHSYWINKEEKEKKKLETITEKKEEKQLLISIRKKAEDIITYYNYPFLVTCVKRYDDVIRLYFVSKCANNVKPQKMIMTFELSKEFKKNIEVNQLMDEKGNYLTISDIQEKNYSL